MSLCTLRDPGEWVGSLLTSSMMSENFPTQHKEGLLKSVSGTTRSHHLVCKDKGAIYPKDNEALLPHSTVWECQYKKQEPNVIGQLYLNKKAGEVQDRSSAILYFSVLQLLLKQISHIIQSFKLNPYHSACFSYAFNLKLGNCFVAKQEIQKFQFSYLMFCPA